MAAQMYMLMVDIPNSTTIRHFALKKNLSVYAMLFDTTGGSLKIIRGGENTEREISVLRREREQAERMTGPGFPMSKVVLHSQSRIYTWR